MAQQQLQATSTYTSNVQAGIGGQWQSSTTQVLQQYFDLQGMHDAASLLTILNLQEKGSDTMVLHLGSHSVKFGLASQTQPFIAPNVIAYPRKDGKKLFDIDDVNKKTLDITRQQLFDLQVEKSLPEIEHQLRKKRFLLIDAKSAKNIRNKQVSFKVYDETNSLNEYNEQGEDSFMIGEQGFLTSDLCPNLEKFSFVNLPETTAPDTGSRPIFVGREALALHGSEEYVLRYPIKYGDLNVTEAYNIHDCISDQQTILETVIQKYMRINKRNLENFNLILVIPDIFVKHHLRQIVNMLLSNMKFKSLFMHTESVMATFAMAMSSACVVDIGSSKISVCCIDEGLLVPKSIQRKHYGGDELNEMLYRLLCRGKGLHHFPRQILCPEYHYHKQLLEFVKENYTLTEMDLGETVKTCQIKIKDKVNSRQRKINQLTFNCSDALLLTPQSLFYSQLIGIMQKVNEETTDQDDVQRGDPLQIVESFQDPEDLMHDIILGMNVQNSGGIPGGILKTAQSFMAKQEDTPGNTPSVSIQQDMQSDAGDNENTEMNGEKFMSQYQKMKEPMDLDELICRSIGSIENLETRKKLANSIILIGGTSKTRKLTDSLEEAVMDRFTSGFDNTIERVNVELYNVQQHQQFLQHQTFLQSTGQPYAEAVPEHLKIDPRFTSWVGASIIPKLESSKDMYIQRDKFVIDFRPYREHFQEQRDIQIQAVIDQQNADQEEKKANEDILQVDNCLKEANGGGHLDKVMHIVVNPESQLTSAQIDQIEKEVGRKLKKERNFDGGVKQIREKTPFHL